MYSLRNAGKLVFGKEQSLELTRYGILVTDVLLFPYENAEKKITRNEFGKNIG